MNPIFKFTSERTLLIRFPGGMSLDNHHKVHAAFQILFSWDPKLIRNLHPAYASLLVEFDPHQMKMDTFLERVQTALNVSNETTSALPSTIKIPVLYDGEDLESLSFELSLSVSEIIQLHSSTVYTVFFLGFQPGFPYLGELPSALRVPRLASPRIKVPAGSVAISGTQSGIYPRESPGGWRLLGRTPFDLFDPKNSPPTSLQMGDRVQFHSIDLVEYSKLRGIR